MTKPLTPTLAICLAASAAMVGALFVEPDKPKATGLDETSSSQSAGASPSAAATSDAPTDHQSHSPKDERTGSGESTEATTDATDASSEPTTEEPTQPSGTPSQKPDDYEEDQDGGADGANKPPPPDYTMTIQNMQIPSITVEPGDIVKVINGDDVEHTVTAVNGSFGTDVIPAGRSRTFQAPADPGSYDVYCKPHTSMTATVTVS